MKKILNLSIVAISALLLQSCASPISGCTDAQATNYNADADKDCNCCNYKGEVVFWYGKNVAEAFRDGGTTSLKVYVDGQLKTSAANVYFTTTPNCNGNGTMTTSVNLGSVKNKAYEYVIKNQNDEILVDGIANYTANTCLKVEIEL